ncbi:MAG: hypothetical protein K2I89_11265 [Muribaculaceae bacterium]|nr:hypothetical protein [Muribaculaceae bacterium]
MTRDLENKFFREFQYDGAAIMSLEMMQFEYCGIGNGTASRKDYPDGVLAEIHQRTEKYDAWPWGGVENCSPLMDEIADNLAFRPKDSREMYAEELICKMQTWTWLYSLSKEKLDAVSNSIRLHSIEDFFFTWRSAFRSFAEKLAVILAKLGINILEIQNRCGITIIERLDVNDLWMVFGTLQLAEYHLSKLDEGSVVSKTNYSVKTGRPSSTDVPFTSLLIGTAEECNKILKQLHALIDGRKGKRVAMVIQACVEAGRLCEPTFPQVESYFPNIGSPQAYSPHYGHCKGNDYNVIVELFKNCTK